MKLRFLRNTVSYERKKSLYGYGFISIWIVGFITFFIRPMIMVFRYSYSKIVYLDNGYRLDYLGFGAYIQALREDSEYIRLLVESFQSLLFNVPIIVAVSLIIATILNQNFKGRTFYRAIFFIPVIVASGIVISILKGDAIAQVMLNGQKSSAMFKVTGLQQIMNEMDFPTQLTGLLTSAANSVFDLLWKSGIQILLFLAGLKTIPASIFEASSIEGATGWDNFWKITIPMVSPMILLTIIYTIIDSFTDYNNSLMIKIIQSANNMDVTYSSAMSLIYFTFIILFVGIVYVLIDKKVFYQVD